MSAIDMLEADHREVEKLFETFEKATSARQQRAIFNEIADKLAVHAAIEEQHFYPAAKTDDTEDLLLEAVEEHLAAKRLIADLLRLPANEESFAAKVTVLKEQIEHHVEEEEGELFPQVRDLLDDETLDALEQEMAATKEELLAKGDPRDAVLGQTGEAAQI